MQKRLKRLLIIARNILYSPGRLLTPVYYTQHRLMMGGALVFCIAVVTQLLQIPPPQLTTALWLALWSATLAMPPLVGVLVMYVMHERVKIRHDTGYQAWMVFVGGAGTVLSVGHIFYHFVGRGTWVLIALMFLVSWSVGRDRAYHAKLNAPKTEGQPSD